MSQKRSQSNLKLPIKNLTKKRGRITRSVDDKSGASLIYEDDAEQHYKIIDIEKQKEDFLQKGWEGTVKYLNETIRKMEKLQKEHPDINFWIKKIIWKKTRKGYIQFSVRPYVQGYGCDGTTGHNIYLIAMKWAERSGYNFSKIYERAYIYEWVQKGQSNWEEANKADEMFYRIKEMHEKYPETIIPDKIDVQLMIEDLKDINAKSLASEIEKVIEEFKKIWEQSRKTHTRKMVE